MDSVAIVVLNWNGIEDTLRCLASLKEQTYQNFRIILIDNGSTEKSTESQLQKAENEYGELLEVIRNKTNDGFAGGVNIGIRYALEHNFAYVALFNNDATADPDWVATLMKASEENNSAITTGLLLNADGSRIDSTGDWYSSWGLPFPRGRKDSRDQAPESGFVFGASGGASLYRTSLFKDIGLFDTAFFAYYEDVDISFRAQLKGYKVFYTNKAIAYHIQGASSDKVPGFAVKQTFKNLPWLFWKNIPSGLLLPIGLRFFIAYHLMLGKALLGPARFMALRGYVASWLRTPIILMRRLKIQSSRRVSSRYINKILWHDIPPDQAGLRKLLRR